MNIPDIITPAIPVFIVTLVVEILYAKRIREHWYETKDTAASLSMGIGNVITNLLGKFLVFGVFSFLWQFRIFEFSNVWWAWVILFFLDDFSYYWFHRKSHEIRWFWASHVVHHSSQFYNLGTALRQTWTGNFAGGFIFWCWLPLIGFEPWKIMLMQSISLLYQYWIHTEAIHKLPKWFEFIFNTPSHHRVHHGSDPIYIDKNHAGVLIIWDRIFGTFQEEIFHPKYGLTRNIDSFNPIKIAFHEWITMIKDIKREPKKTFRWMFGRPE
jgi:sterol desaturase/sphingolipid hydroxylase (fatty acid hydroxylase superfamily)